MDFTIPTYKAVLQKKKTCSKFCMGAVLYETYPCNDAVLYSDAEDLLAIGQKTIYVSHQNVTQSNVEPSDWIDLCIL